MLNAVLSGANTEYEYGKVVSLNNSLNVDTSSISPRIVSTVTLVTQSCHTNTFGYSH